MTGERATVGAVSPADVAEAAAGVRAVLAAIEAGQLTCTAAMRHRMEGAAVALESLSTSTGTGRSARCPA